MSTIHDRLQILYLIFQVKTEYAKKKGIIVIDGQESLAVNIPGDGNTLDVDGKLYLGGLPVDYTAKNIGNVRSLFFFISFIQLIERNFFS